MCWEPASLLLLLAVLGAVFWDGLMALPYVKVLSSSSLSLALVTSKYHGIFRIWRMSYYTLEGVEILLISPPFHTPLRQGKHMFLSLPSISGSSCTASQSLSLNRMIRDYGTQRSEAKSQCLETAGLFSKQRAKSWCTKYRFCTGNSYLSPDPRAGLGSQVLMF